jgi:hypothetical protein
MATVSRNDFISQFANAKIDLNNPDPEITARLAEANVTLDDLRRIAGDDGIISGKDEAKDLYYLVEKHDHNGTFKSLEVGVESDNMSSLTEAGAIYDTLMDAVERSRTSRPEAPKAAPKPTGGEPPQTKIAGQHTGGRASEADRQRTIDHFKNDLGFKNANSPPPRWPWSMQPCARPTRPP